MSDQTGVSGSELDRFAGLVTRQIDQGFQGVNQRIDGVERRFTGVEDTLKDHGEKIAVLMDRQGIPLDAGKPSTVPKRAVLWGTSAGTGAVFVWAALKAAATWIWGTKP